jgi:hypothetical protein
LAVSKTTDAALSMIRCRQSMRRQLLLEVQHQQQAKTHRMGRRVAAPAGRSGPRHKGLQAPRLQCIGTVDCVASHPVTPHVCHCTGTVRTHALTRAQQKLGRGNGLESTAFCVAAAASCRCFVQRSQQACALVQPHSLLPILTSVQELCCLSKLIGSRLNNRRLAPYTRPAGSHSIAAAGACRSTAYAGGSAALLLSDARCVSHS